MNQINFEDDQTEILDKTDDIDKLANKIKEMQSIQKDIEQNEEYLKQRKKDLEQVSGEAIPTMLSEMGLSYLKLADGSSVEVKTNYSATITQANKALVRERIEGGKPLPTEIFNVFIGNKTTIKRKQ